MVCRLSLGFTRPANRFLFRSLLEIQLLFRIFITEPQQFFCLRSRKIQPPLFLVTSTSMWLSVSSRRSESVS